ncbi:hypothetical protein D3C83_227790 [compost metagenome]
MRVDQQVEAAAQHVGSGGEFGAGVGEPDGEAVFLDGDVPQFGADLAGGQCAVGEGVDQSVFLGVEFA